MIKIQEQLSNWRFERNIKLFPETIKDDLLKELQEVKEALAKLDFNNYVEELADIAIFAFNGLGTMGITHKSTRMSIKPSLNSLESYINNIRTEMPVQTVNILNIIITMCEELVTAKMYDFEKVVREKIKVISSRKQCPRQKKEWAKNGISGKWEKMQDQPKETLYVGNYGKCKV
jgi:hypothetical protein